MKAELTVNHFPPSPPLCSASGRRRPGAWPSPCRLDERRRRVGRTPRGRGGRRLHVLVAGADRRLGLEVVFLSAGEGSKSCVENALPERNS